MTKPEEPTEAPGFVAERILDDDALARRIRRLLDRVPNAANRTLVERYVGERRLSVRLSTTLNDLNCMVALCIWLGQKTLDREVNRSDLVAYLTTGHRNRIWRNRSRDGSETVVERRIPLSDETLAQRKIVIRTFYKWLRQTPGKGAYPPEVIDLGSRPKQRDTIMADDLISGDDLRRMLMAQPDARGRAILAVLADAGFRASEVASLNVGSVKFQGALAYLTLPRGSPALKTGARRVFVIDAVPYLHAWLEQHPFKGDREAPLFVTVSRRNPYGRFTANALFTFCRAAGKKAKLGYKVNPHLFRHSAATEKARLGWNEARLRMFFGWTRDSDMPSRYVHLAANDTEDMELVRRGLKPAGDRQRPALEAVICQGCRTSNVVTDFFCKKCRLPISPESIIEDERIRQAQMEEQMAHMFKTRLDQLLKERGLGGEPTSA